MERKEFEAALVEVYSDLENFVLNKVRDKDNTKDIVQQTIAEMLRLRSYERFNKDGRVGKRRATIKTFIIKRLRWRCIDSFKDRSHVDVERCPEKLDFRPLLKGFIMILPFLWLR